MNKLLTTVVGLVMLGGVAVADEPTNKIKDLGTKVSTHISTEIEKTKEFQKKSWAEAKVQWSNLIKKFSTK